MRIGTHDLHFWLLNSLGWVCTQNPMPSTSNNCQKTLIFIKTFHRTGQGLLNVGEELCVIIASLFLDAITESTYTSHPNISPSRFVSNRFTWPKIESTDTIIIFYCSTPKPSLV